MKLTFTRLTSFAALLVLALSSCVPVGAATDRVNPTLISVQLPGDGTRIVTLVGRYFGDGAMGTSDQSYVLVGADSACDGGTQTQALAWSASRIVVDVPSSIGASFVCIVSNGVTSNAMPLDVD